MGLVNRLVPSGEALEAAVALAHELAALPQVCLRSDRMSALEQWGLSEEEAAVNEARRGRDVIAAARPWPGPPISRRGPAAVALRSTEPAADGPRTRRAPSRPSTSTAR